ncbi:MAG: hypothetical protein H0W88_10045 [Parachlamydiaceae bacterium]|nr:hypothetical protein [Parachlamydiaceae bacterium]
MNSPESIIQPAQYLVYEAATPVQQQPAIEQYKRIYPGLTKQIHRKTELLLVLANQISNDILGKKTTPERASADIKEDRKPAEHIDLGLLPLLSTVNYSSSAVVFDNSTNIHHHHHNGEKEKNEDNSGMRIAILIVGTIFAGIATYFVGKSYAKNEDVKDEELPFETLVEDWKKNRDIYSTVPEYQEKVEDVVNRSLLIHTNKKTDRKYKMAYIVSLAATGVLWVGGAAVGAATTFAMLAPGLVLGSLSTIAMLGRYGYRSNSQQDTKNAKWIEQNLTQLNQMPINPADID